MMPGMWNVHVGLYWYVSATIVQYSKCAYKYICISVEDGAKKKNNKRTKYQTHTQNIVHHAQSTYCQSNGVTNNKATILHKWGQNVHKFYGFNATHPLHHHHPHGWWHGFYLDFIATFEPKLLALFTVIHLFADCIAPMDIMTIYCGAPFLFCPWYIHVLFPFICRNISIKSNKLLSCFLHLNCVHFWLLFFFFVKFERKKICVTVFFLSKHKIHLEKLWKTSV